MALNKNLSDLRREYLQPEFTIESTHEDPFIQFDNWFEEVASLDPDDVNSMTLATATPNGIPSTRVVLLKGIEQNKFIFYTNYQSQKGREMEANPAVCLNFYWPLLNRQVRIDGKVTRVDEQTSTEYFQSRPRGAQVGAWASPQSSEIINRKILEERIKEIEEKFKGVEKLPKPKQWGGYAVVPERFEFFQGRPNRLHDRILYLPDQQGGWKKGRLSP